MPLRLAMKRESAGQIIPRAPRHLLSERALLHSISPGLFEAGEDLLPQNPLGSRIRD